MAAPVVVPTGDSRVVIETKRLVGDSFASVTARLQQKNRHPVRVWRKMRKVIGRVYTRRFRLVCRVAYEPVPTLPWGLVGVSGVSL
jgi:hypothetical protein